MATAEKVDSEYQRYIAEIDLYEKEFRAWETRSKKVVRLYKDADNTAGKTKRFNVLWSNVQTLLPALYARDPQPVAERRFKDSDNVGRVASEVIERCLSYTIDCQNYGGVTRQAVSDRLLPGRGVAWHRYQAEGEEGSDQYTEQVVPDYVYWQDFGHAVARTWDEVPMVWRKVYLTRQKLVKRFGDAGKGIPLDYTPKGLKDEKVGEDVKKACIYEIWDKDRGVVAFLSRSYPKVIESVTPPIRLTNYFPCQKPLFATITTDSLVPTPDYALYQTQAQELEELTARIDSLQDALRLNGAYDASAPELANLLRGNNKLIPVTNWSQFSEKGGIEGAISFVPIKEVAETLIALYESREKSKQDLYEITGIADIIRGNSEPSETATAQQIKGRFAVLRISDAQSDVQRWVRDGIRIMGEIICENFALDTIKAISGMRLPMQAEKEAFLAQQQLAAKTGQQMPVDEKTAELMRQPSWEEVHALISHQALREFRIDIETDSTVRTDEELERQQRTELLNVAGVYLQKVVEASQIAPEIGPLAGELLMFGIRGHRAARSLEPVFDDAMKKLQKPKQPQPDPELMKEQVKQQGAKELAQIKAQTDIQVEQARQEMQARENLHTQQIEDQRSDRESLRNMEMERYKADITKEVEMFKAQLKAETDLRVAEITAQQNEEVRAFKAKTDADKRQADEAKQARDAQTKIEIERLKSIEAERDREFKRRQAEESEKSKGERVEKRQAQIKAAQELLNLASQLKRARVN